MVVKEIDKVIEFYSSTFSIGPWIIWEGNSEAKASDRIYRYKTKTAIAPLGPVMLELFQLVEGRSPVHSDFLDKGRQGVHHFGFYTTKEEKEQIIANLTKAGLRVVQSAEIKGRGNNAFLDTGKKGDLFFEIIDATPTPIPQTPKPVGKVELPPTFHVGIAVKDVDKAVNLYLSTFGIGPWETRKGNDKTKVGDQAYTFSAKTAFTRFGSVMLELFQVTERRLPVHAAFIDKAREGVHHLGFYVSKKENEQMIASLSEIGIGVIQADETRSGTYTFLDTEKTGGLFFTLVER